MGVSATGQRIHMSAVRNGVATAIVFLSLFYYFYGPPLTNQFSEAANAECNHITGGSYRNYVLEWRTTSFDGVNVPHWQCYEVGEPVSAGVDLGWWVDP